jgi:hypothetical protein
MYSTRRSGSLRALLVVGVLASATLLAGAGAHADVGATQQVVLVADKPVKGRFVVKYRDWSQAKASAVCVPRAGCYEVNPVAKGQLQTKLTTYQLKERVKKYNYFLLDADTLVTSKGDWGGSIAYVKITNADGPTLVDHTETGSVSASKPWCADVGLSLSTPWPVVVGAVDLGHVKFCDKAASFTRSRSGSTVVYKANKVASARHLDVNRWVKVRAGRWPIFTVRVVAHHDTCQEWADTPHGNRVCVQATTVMTTHRYKIYTS